MARAQAVVAGNQRTAYLDHGTPPRRQALRFETHGFHRGVQRALKAGARFSMNARMASAKSSDCMSMPLRVAASRLPLLTSAAKRAFMTRSEEQTSEIQ